MKYGSRQIILLKKKIKRNRNRKGLDSSQNKGGKPHRILTTKVRI